MPTKIEPFYARLGSNIQKAREQRRMTQAQLGMALRPPSTRASIANVENGKQRVLVHTLVQIATTLDVRFQDVIPTAESRAQVPEVKVQRELKRKLKLADPQLKKLTAAARLSISN